MSLSFVVKLSSRQRLAYKRSMSSVGGSAEPETGEIDDTLQSLDFGADILPDSNDSEVFAPEMLWIDELFNTERLESPGASGLEEDLLRAVCKDDVSGLVAAITELASSPEGSLNTKGEAILTYWFPLRLLLLSCKLDSEACLSYILDGNTVSVDQPDEYGKTALHHAAENHSARCTEALLRRHANADFKSKNGDVPLQSALQSKRSVMQINWYPSENVLRLLESASRKDLTVVRALTKSTKDVRQIVSMLGVQGDITALAALLLVTGDVSLSEHDIGLILEVLFRRLLGLDTHLQNKVVNAKNREMLLKELELLLYWNPAVLESHPMTSYLPLIRAVQVGDEAVVNILLKAHVNVNAADVDGNTSLHWCFHASSTCNIRLVNQLVEHGASVTLGNRLVGLTPVHMAASRGHLQALEILLTRNPQSIHATTATKETPLFFAVKNNRLDCARLLLQHGAKRQVMNLRKQRPIELASTGEMRALLEVQGIVSTGKAMAKEVRGGCRMRRNNDAIYQIECFKRNQLQKPDGRLPCAAEEIARTTLARPLQPASLKPMKHSEPFSKKVFVGGLPPPLHSDDLREFFEKNFGPVLDAVVQPGDHILSQGFGFVTFTHEDSASAALRAHHVNIFGEKVEIRNAVPTQAPSEGLRTERGESLPIWAKRFRQWFPKFLRLKKGEQYPLSSLKKDFRGICGMELDHASLGYQKLSDFLHSMPEICTMRIVPMGQGPATHMVLQQAFPQTRRRISSRQISSRQSLVDPGRSYAAAVGKCVTKTSEMIKSGINASEASFDHSSNKAASAPVQENVVFRNAASKDQPLKTVQEGPLLHYNLRSKFTAELSSPTPVTFKGYAQISRPQQQDSLFGALDNPYHISPWFHVTRSNN